MTRLAVLMTCHNRREKTLACLKALFASNLSGACHLDVFLVEDGCTDGTEDAVSRNYPEVNVIHGTGHLYWAGGMRLAWREAAKGNYDYYLWLNDDTLIYPNAILALLESALRSNSEAIICATVVSGITGKVTYGGKMRTDRDCIVPNGKLTRCEIVNGNCLLVPRSVYELLGPIDHCFIHAIGDWDYGLRAAASGIQCFVTAEAHGTCEANPHLPNWCRKEIPLQQRLISLYSPLASAQPKPYFIFVKRHYGLMSAIRQLITMHVRVLFPGLWIKS